MEKQFFVKQFLKPTLMAADPHILNVEYKSGPAAEIITIEHSGYLTKINVIVTEMSKTEIIKECLKHI